MYICRATVVAAAFALAVCAPSVALNAQQANQIGVNDFANADRTYTHSTTVPLRRGEVSTVTIVKDFIDLVSFNDVRLEGSGTMSVVGNGRINGGTGMGFLRVRITLGAGVGIGNAVTLKVGSQDTFRFRAVHRGLLTTVTRTPEPSTVAGTTPWVTRVVGVDLGNAELLAMNCHTITYSNRTADAFSATATRANTCNTTNFGARVEPSSDTDAPSMVNASGNTVSFQFSYLAAGLACVSTPGIGAPVLTQPQQGQVFNFLPGTPGTANVTFSWNFTTQTNTAAPNNEWILTRELGAKASGLSGFITSKVVDGLTTTFSVGVPGTHTFTLRAKNCGQPAPSTTVQFSTRYQ